MWAGRERGWAEIRAGHVTTLISKPGINFPALPGLTLTSGKLPRTGFFLPIAASGDRLIAVIGEPVSLDHQLSLILAPGAPYRCKSCWYSATKVTPGLSPPRKSPFRDLRPPVLPILFKYRFSGSSPSMVLKAASRSQLGGQRLECQTHLAP
jgi:hypothetical protein